jgi:hypothetical protein
MFPARRGIETKMTASRTTRRISRRTRAARKSTAARRTAKPQSKAAAAKPLSKLAARLIPPPQVHFRLCRPGWAVIVDKIPNVSGTRFVCPFCPLSHRVPGPVRGFRKFRRAQWVKLRRVEE